MQLIIHKSADLTPSTIAVITEKVNKLETFWDRIERAEVFVKESDGTAANGHKVEIRLAIPGNDLYADYTDPSVKRAAAEVTDALRRQIKKAKDKLNDHHADSSIPPMGPNDDPERIITSEEQL